MIATMEMAMRWLAAPAALADFIVPAPSPLRNPRLPKYFGMSIVLLHAAFHVLSHTAFRGADPKKRKQRCWILTTVNAFAMTAASTPYLYDLLASGFDLHAVKCRAWLAEPMSCFFVAYLVSDLGLGSIYYRHLINLSSGWIHHSVYTFLFAYWLHQGWSHIAVMACVFELPTFIMGIASLHPPLRSNMAFTSTFFLTRIFFHFGILLATITPHGRATPSINGSWGPAVSVIVTYPMHLWWGYKCILSVRRRMHKRKLESRKVREARAAEAGAAAQYFQSAGQLFTGLPDPSTSSALNTPATTPGSSPLLAPADKKPVSAFQRAAAVAGSPITLVMGRRTKDSDVNGNAFSLGESMTSGSGGPNGRHPFTSSVRPEGATEEHREPFLAIRSQAETRDRARRLVADAIRKAWMRQPDSWRRQLEAEMTALADAPKSRSETPATNSAQLSRRPSDEYKGVLEGKDDDDEDAVDADGASQQDIGISSALPADREQEARSRAQRGKAAARRAFVRAIRRAINGPANGRETDAPHDQLSSSDEEILGDRTAAAVAAATTVVAAPLPIDENGTIEGDVSPLEGHAGGNGVDEQILQPLPGALPVIDGVRDEAQADQVVQEARQQHRLLQMMLRIGGATLPPDMLGQEYSVREFPVERNDQISRHRRLIDQIRRRMEVARRDVVVFD